jgi:hypothetical protein
MSAETESRELLPIACTLGTDEGAQRIGDWRRLGKAFGVGRVTDVGEVTMRFRDAPGVEAELDRLVAAERICCPFLLWNITRTPSGWQLVISGAEDVLKALPVVL